MAQISTAEHLQDLLTGTKSKYHHLSDRTVVRGVPQHNFSKRAARSYVLGKRVKWMHSGFYKRHYHLFLYYLQDLGDAYPTIDGVRGSK